MENIVYNELLIRGYNVDVGVVEIFDKDKEGKRVRKQLEVDFVVNQGNQRYYIQVLRVGGQDIKCLNKQSTRATLNQ